MIEDAVGGPARVIDGRYRVVALLGQGAHGRTFRCVDDAGRAVAVKELIVRGQADWKPIELFEREAKVLAALRHHGVPALDRFFEATDAHGDLAFYLVQELIDGPSLRDRVAAGPLDPDEVVRIALGVLDVLEYLHGRAPPVFHRDIKPANIVLRPSGAPVLVDFGGVCHGWRADDGGSTVVGTFGYMPAEQLLGQVEPASDLYALGATMLHLVTGRPPAAHSYAAGRLAVPPELDVAPTLRAAIDAMLAPAPGDRPRTAQAARGLLLGQASTALAAVPRAGVGLARRPAAVLAGPAAPRLADLGPPPRDPRGPHADVLRVLCEPLDDDSEGVGAVIFGWTVFIVISVVTVGVVPALYYGSHVRGRRRRYQPLFEHGLQVAGEIVSVARTDASMMATIGYEYEVAGARYRGFIDYAARLARYWREGDPITVLHDPADPGRSCAVYVRDRRAAGAPDRRS
ncbi:MAG TPA: protein kinase [Kofleriaceae bacterium]|nr:protein kinase [Kofleriaceae bacterium]